MTTTHAVPAITEYATQNAASYDQASRSGCCDATLTNQDAAGWTCDACHGPVVVNVHA